MVVVQAVSDVVITDHGALAGLGDDDHTQYLLVDGTRAMSGALNMGANKVTNMAGGAVAGDAVEVVQALAFFVTKSGDTMAGALIFPDNTELRFGTGGDSTIEYDGTNTIWNPKAVGSGHIEIQGDLLFADNNEIFFGTGKDASILFNGTNLIIDSALVGSGKTVFRKALLMQDNIHLEFGNSGDWTMDYDSGTGNLVVNQAVGSGIMLVSEELRATTVRSNNAFNHNGTAGETASHTWQNAQGDDVTITVSGGIVTVFTVAAP